MAALILLPTFGFIVFAIWAFSTIGYLRQRVETLEELSDRLEDHKESLRKELVGLRSKETFVDQIQNAGSMFIQKT